MNYKETFGKVGMVLISFLLALFLIDALGSGIWATTLTTINRETANKVGLQFLWTNFATMTIIQAFVLYATLLGTNLLFSPMKEENKKGGRD